MNHHGRRENKKPKSVFRIQTMSHLEDEDTQGEDHQLGPVVEPHEVGSLPAKGNKSNKSRVVQSELRTCHFGGEVDALL